MKDKLAKLQQLFNQQLPEKIAKIEESWQRFSQFDSSHSNLLELHRQFHTLTGSAGTFGAIAVSNLARDIDDKLRSHLDGDDKVISFTKNELQNIDALIAKLKQTAINWQPSDIPFIKPIENNELSATSNSISSENEFNSNLIYLVEDDEHLAADLVNKLVNEKFEVRHFSCLSDFETEVKKKMPAVIIMDIVFDEGSTAGIEAVARLKNTCDKCPPVIFISVRDDIEARLLAARAGASRYFCKPINVKKLVTSLNGLTTGLVSKPYRALIIDDDQSLLEYYSTVLGAADLEVKTLSNSKEGVNALIEFKPDVIVLDVHMPECSGPELAQVIRQDDTWALIPILFLSSETDPDIQLQTRNFGGDDFLMKPVKADHLVSVVISKAKRARWAHRLNNDLKTALRENQFQLATMDQHDIVSTTDIAGRITSVNNKFCEISGYSREELLGKNHRVLKSTHHSKSFYEDIWKTISSGNVWHGIICNLNKQGKEYWVESTIVPFLDEKGKPYKYVSARTDITLLRQSEERLERSQAFANIGTWDWNIQNGELFWSDRIWPLFGYTKESTKTTYDNFLAAVHPEDREAVVDAINNCVEHGADYNLEHRVVWPNGSVRWVHERGDVVRGEDGVPLHMLGVVQDIHARKNAEQGLIEREKQLREAQTLARIGNWQANLVTGELIWSDEIYRIFGYEPKSFEPSVKAFHAVVHPDDREKVNESEKLAEQSGYHDVQHRIVLPDGSVRHVHELAQAETDNEGDVIRLKGTVQDITERREAEIRLRKYNDILELIAKGGELNNVLEAVVEHAEKIMKDGICSILLLDETGKYFTNGVSPGLPDFYNEAIDGLEIGMGVGSCGEAAASGKSVIVSDVMEHPNWVAYRDVVQKAGLRACWSKPIFSSTNAVLGTFAIYYKTPKEPDAEQLKLTAELAQFVAIVVERALFQQALVKAKEEAENANRAKSQFLSSMSHELRTPMNAIMGFSQLLKMETEDVLNESQLENVEEITKASTHLLDLINEVLDLSKIEAGRIDLSVESVTISEVIAEALQLITPLAQKRDIEIILKASGNEVSFEQLLEQKNSVRADRTRLKQVLLNLLSNAVKYNVDSGRICIEYHLLDNNLTRMSVTDTGAGLSQEQQNNLFKAFERLGAEQSDTEGTGIGLVITKNIVELMGGNIGVESEQGKGSTFWFELATDDSKPEQHNVEDKNPTIPSESTTGTKHQHTVLYIEDNPANLRLVSQVLARRKNIHLWSAHEPMLGLELAMENKPDLILLDINLPGMDGYGVLKQLRQWEATCHIPVIAISANAMQKDIQRGMDAGFDDYITKPIDVKALLNAVDNKLSINNE